MSDKPIQVSVAMIGRHGRYLIRKRPPLPGSPMPGYWEFPGGKCLEYESPEECASREVLEEVGLEIEIVRLRRVIHHVYPHGHVKLHFYDCVTRDPNAEPAGDTGFRWVAASELPRCTFPGANDQIVAELVAEATRHEAM